MAVVSVLWMSAITRYQDTAQYPHQKPKGNLQSFL